MFKTSITTTTNNATKDSTQRFGLPAFNKSSRSCSNLATNLATAGLFSAIAACGGSSTDTDTGTGDTNTNTLGSSSIPYSVSLASAETASVEVVEKAQGFPTYYSLHDVNENVTFASADNTNTEFTLKKTTDRGFTLNKGEDIFFTISTGGSNGLHFFHGDVDGNGIDELMIINRGSITLRTIWDFTTHVTSAGIAFNPANNSFTDTNDAIHRFSLTAPSGDPFGVSVIGVEGMDGVGNRALLMVNSEGSNSASGAGHIYLVWNPKDYNDITTNATDDAINIWGATAAQYVGRELPTPVQIDRNSAHELTVYSAEGQGTSGLTNKGIFYVIWDIRSVTAKVELKTDGTEIEGVLAIFGAQLHEKVGQDAEFADLDGDGLNDMWLIGKEGTATSPEDVKGYIIWGSAITNASGGGRDGVINLAEGADGINAFSSTGNGGFTNAGLWIDTPDLDKVKENFYFVDIDGDGIKDARATLANANGTYDWWAMNAGENELLGNDTAGYNFGTKSGAEHVFGFASKNIPLKEYTKKNMNSDSFIDVVRLVAISNAEDPNNAGKYQIGLGDSQGMFSTASGRAIYKTASELLNDHNIVPSEYLKKEINNDGNIDILELEPISAGEDGAGLHRVWLGKTDGKFDLAKGNDAYVRVTVSDVSSLADSAADFQLVDIA